jgi:hypothetical protein
MATDQDEKTTTGQSGINYTAADCDALLTKFSRGNLINAADIVTLFNYYDDYKSHTHNVTDLTTKDTFGNLSGNQGVSYVRTTGNTRGTNATASDPNNTTTITAVDYTTVRNMFNSLRSHTHYWDDKQD